MGRRHRKVKSHIQSPQPLSKLSKKKHPKKSKSNPHLYRTIPNYDDREDGENSQHAIPIPIPMNLDDQETTDTVELSPFSTPSPSIKLNRPRIKSLERKLGRRDIFVMPALPSPKREMDMNELHALSLTNQRRQEGVKEEAIRKELQELYGIARERIDQLLERGEAMKKLEEQADQLVESGFALRGNVQAIRHGLCRRRCLRICLLSGCVITILCILLIMVYVTLCGWTFQVASCFSSSSSSNNNNSLPAIPPSPSYPPSRNLPSQPPLVPSHDNNSNISNVTNLF